MASARARSLKIRVGERVGSVSALWLHPDAARAALVLAHGAGAGMRHAFLEGASRRLAERGVATLRFQFPYMEKGEREGKRRPPDPPRVLAASVRAAVDRAGELAPGLPLFAGGKSLGGRMSSTTASENALPGVRGLVFYGFPLHAPGRPGRARAAHLAELEIPLLFLQGTRDALASLDELRPVLEQLGRRATLHVAEEGDHSFHVPKRSGRSDEEVQDELAERVAEWIAELC